MITLLLMWFVVSLAFGILAGHCISVMGLKDDVGANCEVVYLIRENDRRNQVDVEKIRPVGQA